MGGFPSLLFPTWPWSFLRPFSFPWKAKWTSPTENGQREKGRGSDQQAVNKWWREQVPCSARLPHTCSSSWGTGW